MNATPPAIEVDALTKTYGDVEAVRGVSFTVGRGEVFGFLGPNGAGKSTTINMLCTLARPTAGTATVSGYDIVAERDDVRRHIGLVFQDPTLDGYLTAAQNLRLHAELYGMDNETIDPRMTQVLEMVDLADRRDSPVMRFSGGMKRRLEIARGLMHSPPVLFLDEPTIGLDPQTRSSIWRYIRALHEAEGTTIFMTTHYMDEAEFCDRIAIIDRGEIVVLDTPEALKASVGADRVMLGTADDDAALGALRDRFGIEATVAEGAVTFHVASFSAIFSAASLVWDRELGFLREMMVAPVRRSSIILGKCLGGTTIAATQGMIVVTLAGLVHVPYDPVLLLGIFGLELLLAFTVSAFGVMVAMSIKQARSFTYVVQMLVMPLTFLSGALYPVSGLPTWLAALNRINPLTYAVDAMRRLVFDHLDISEASRHALAPGVTWWGWRVPSLVEAGIVLALGIVLLAIAIFRFTRAE